MKYDISLLGVYLSSKDVYSWSRSLWRFDSTDYALVLGLPGDLRSAGSAIVVGRSGGSWGRRVSLLASDGKRGDGFGFQVAMWRMLSALRF